MGSTIALTGGFKYKQLTYQAFSFSSEDLKYFRRAEKAWFKASPSVVLQSVDRDPQVLVYKTCKKDMVLKFGKEAGGSGLSLTWRNTPIEIHIHEDNWNTLPVHHGTDFTDLDEYRVAILNHEFAHALGHDHVSCPCKNAEKCT